MPRCSVFNLRYFGVLAAAVLLACATARVVIAQNDNKLQLAYSVARRNLQNFSRLEVYPTILTYQVRKGRINLGEAFATHQVDNEIAVQEQALFADQLLSQGKAVQQKIEQHFAHLPRLSSARRSSSIQQKQTTRQGMSVYLDTGTTLDIWPERLPRQYAK